MDGDGDVDGAVARAYRPYDRFLNRVYPNSRSRWDGTAYHHRSINLDPITIPIPRPHLSTFPSPNDENNHEAFDDIGVLCVSTTLTCLSSYIAALSHRANGGDVGTTASTTNTSWTHTHR